MKEELFIRIAGGDQAAFSVLFKKYSKLLYSFIYEHTDSPELADDIVQEVFTKIWITRESLPAVRQFHAYLFVLARNQVINEIKKRVRERKRNLEWVQLHQPEIDEGERVQAGMRLDIIDQAIDQLPGQQQKVWILSRKDGMKYSEIAAELKLSRETVKKYIQYANQSISKFLISKLDLLIMFVFLKIL